MSSLTDLFKNLRNFETLAQDMRAKVDAIEAVGEAGGGMVQVTLSGQGAMKRLTVDPSLLKPEAPDLLSDLVLAAHADARAKLEGAMGEAMRGLTGGLPLPPGFKMPF